MNNWRGKLMLKLVAKNTTILEKENVDSNQSQELELPSTSMDQIAMEDPDIANQDFIDCSDDSVKDPDYTRLKKRTRSSSSSSCTSLSSSSPGSSSSSSASRQSVAKNSSKTPEIQDGIQVGSTETLPTIAVSELYQAEDLNISNKTKKDRKRKADPSKWQRQKAKVLRNLGKSYIPNSKNKSAVPERSLKAPCPNTCKFKCSELISQDKRQFIFDSYWLMGDLQRQREFIARHITMIKPRYAYKVHNSKRGNNFAFHLTVDEQIIRVCKAFFRATLDISDKPIKTVVEKITIQSIIDETVFIIDYLLCLFHYKLYLSAIKKQNLPLIVKKYFL